MAYIYTIKLIDTLYHGIFAHPVAAQTVVGLNILSGLSQMLFFIAILRQYASHGNTIIKIGAWLSVIGSVVAPLPKLLAMNLLLSSDESLWFEYSANIGAFCPWWTAILLFCFCLLFLADLEIRGHNLLKMAFLAGAGGWLIMAMAQSLVMINYVTSGRLVWFRDLFSVGPIVFVISSSLAFLGIGFFTSRLLVIIAGIQQKPRDEPSLFS